MNYSRTAALQPKAVSAGMLLLVGGAFTMMQLTSLVLGSAPSRQLHLSLAVPAVDLEDGPDSLGGQVDAVLGAIAAVVPAPAQNAARVALASPARLKSAGSRPVVVAARAVDNTFTVARTAPPVDHGRARHDDRGHGRER